MGDDEAGMDRVKRVLFICALDEQHSGQGKPFLQQVVAAHPVQLGPLHVEEEWHFQDLNKGNREMAPPTSSRFYQTAH